MLRRSFRIGLTLGLLGGLVFALVKLFGSRGGVDTAPTPVRGEPWPRLATEPPATKPAAKKAPAKQKAPAKAWVEPKGDVCPTSHPVKAKLASKIFHLPGMANYERTKPDRCYVDAAKAEADGLRAAKR